MKIKILICILTFTITQAQTYGLKKVIDLPTSAPDFSIVHDDAFVFHNSVTNWANASYMLDSNKIALKTFSNKFILSLKPRNKRGALIRGGNDYFIVDNLMNYLTSSNYPIKVLDTLVNQEVLVNMGYNLFEVDSNNNAYVIYENLRWSDYSSDEFILKKVNLESFQRKKKVFTHNQFGSLSKGSFLKFDVSSKGLCIATDSFFIRVDTNLNVVSKIEYTKWKPRYTTMDKYSNILTISKDTLFYLNKNLEVLKYFKLELSTGSLHQIAVDSRDRVFLTFLNQEISTLYQVDFNNIITETSDETVRADAYLTQTSNHSFEINMDQVAQVSLHNMLGQKENFDQPSFTSQLKGLVVMNIHLKNGDLLSKKMYLGL